MTKTLPCGLTLEKYAHGVDHERDFCLEPFDVSWLCAEVVRLRDLAIEMSDHLDYCGYGDPYEREWADVTGLRNRVDAFRVENKL